jgi:branched-chain amino acid transport system ATP-binding protein
MALVGPNGAGKSSFLHCLIGTLPADTGQFRLAGTAFEHLSAARRARLGLRCGFQITRVFARMSVAENLRCASLAAHGVGAWPWLGRHQRWQVERDVERLLEALELTDNRDAPASALSYAQQRVLDLGLGLAGPAPRLLILDEPTAGLSPAEARAMTALIDRVAAGLSLLFVEHDMQVVATLADRVALLADGEVLGVSEPALMAIEPRWLEVYPGLAQLQTRRSA